MAKRNRRNGQYAGDNVPGNPYVKFLRRKRAAATIAGGGGDTFTEIETGCFIPSLEGDTGIAWEIHGILVFPQDLGDMPIANDGGAVAFSLYAGQQAAVVNADSEDFISRVDAVPDDAGGDGGTTFSLPLAMPLFGPVVVADKYLTFHAYGHANAAAGMTFVVDIWYAPLPADRVTLIAMLAAAGRID